MDRFQFEGSQKELIKPLLKGWHDTLDEIEGVNKWGLPYVYGERTNVGILAMAAMKEGYLSFEEYSCKKGRGKNQWTGRADLRLYRKRDRSYLDFEAKCLWTSIRPNKNFINKITGCLDHACKDVKPIEYRSKYAAGIVFLRFYGACHGKLDSDFKKLWDQLRKQDSYGGDFCAYHICSKNWWQRPPEDCPGIALIGRYV